MCIAHKHKHTWFSVLLLTLLKQTTYSQQLCPYVSIYLSIYVCSHIFAAANGFSGRATGCGLAQRI